MISVEADYRYDEYHDTLWGEPAEMGIVHGWSSLHRELWSSDISSRLEQIAKMAAGIDRFIALSDKQKRSKKRVH